MINARPAVRFMCLHHAGHTEMALGFFNHLVGDQAIAWAGEGGLGPEVSPVVLAAMAEVGIDISDQVDQSWIPEAAHVADVEIVTSCDGGCSIFRSQRCEDWKLAEPVGQTVADVRPIRDEIERRVRTLITSLEIRVSHGRRQLALAQTA